MHTKATKSKTDGGGQHEPQPRPDVAHLPPWQNTRPRGNPAPDDHDVERGLERMAALVGR
jgi:hypothetical protein